MKPGKFEYETLILNLDSDKSKNLENVIEMLDVLMFLCDGTVEKIQMKRKLGPVEELLIRDGSDLVRKLLKQMESKP